jgi:hypothetical protein
MNAKRETLRRVSIVLESGEATLLAEFVEMLYRRATEPRSELAHFAQSSQQNVPVPVSTP